MSRRKLLDRKLDLTYLIFFAIHLIVMLNIDLYALYPSSLRPKYMTAIRKFYVSTYNDQFFISAPAWFTLYLYFELLFHVPVCLWSIPALYRDDEKVPIVLLVYAVQTAVTTSTCIAEYLSWSTISSIEKWEMSKLYVPYMAVSLLMGLDMVKRLISTVRKDNTHDEIRNVKKTL